MSPWSATNVGSPSNLHEISLRRDERRLPVDAESNLTILDRPPLSSVRVHAPRRLVARRHRNVVGVQRVVVHHRLGPLRLPLVLCEQFRQLLWGRLGGVQSAGAASPLDDLLKIVYHALIPLRNTCIDHLVERQSAAT